MNGCNKKLSEKDIKQFVNERFNDVKKSKKVKNLVLFHTINKFLIMGHSQEKLKILGKIVASNKKNKISDILIEYENNLNLSLQSKPTIKTHSNVIMHIFGYFSNEFSDIERKKFFELLEDYKNQKITIGKILAEIHPIVYRFNKTYLSGQTYFLLYSNTEAGNIFKMLEN